MTAMKMNSFCFLRQVGRVGRGLLGARTIPAKQQLLMIRRNPPFDKRLSSRSARYCTRTLAKPASPTPHVLEKPTFRPPLGAWESLTNLREGCTRAAAFSQVLSTMREVRVNMINNIMDEKRSCGAFAGRNRPVRIFSPGVLRSRTGSRRKKHALGLNLVHLGAAP